ILLKPILATRQLQGEIRRASARQSAQSVSSDNGHQAHEVVDAPQT
ncbi:MAG: heme exporter protein CcmD, partial [Proteobacteria bacterium]